METRNRVQFDRLDQSRAHEYVAEQIRRQISLHLIAGGAALPPERELARMFGVARKTVQEAVRLLVQDGLIESRRGRNGGNFVVPSQSETRSIGVLITRIRPQRALIEEALTYRLEIEPATAGRSALVRTPQDVDRIVVAARRAAEAATDSEFIEHDTEFHLAIAQSTRNRFLIEAVEQIRVLLNDVLAALPESEVWRERTTIEHQAIVGAIEMGDERSARSAMRTHVAHTDQSGRALLAAI